MRELTIDEVFVASGGVVVPSGNPPDNQYGIVSEVVKWVGSSLAWDKLSKAVDKSVGVAGNNPPANENDNGGTSFGIDVYNTFGD